MLLQMQPATFLLYRYVAVDALTAAVGNSLFSTAVNIQGVRDHRLQTKRRADLQTTAAKIHIYGPNHQPVNTREQLQGTQQQCMLTHQGSVRRHVYQLPASTVHETQKGHSRRNTPLQHAS